MAIELHHLQPIHDDELSRLKARIADLEALNHDLCERVTENDDIRLHWEEIEQTKAENERMKLAQRPMTWPSSNPRTHRSVKAPNFSFLCRV